MVINIQIKNRVATYVPDESHPVCGNAGDTVKFSFDGEWAAHSTKTARFIWGGNKFHEEDFTGDVCPVPAFLNTDRVLIGVYADGGQLASTKAEVPFLASIRCGGAHPDVLSVEAYTHEAKKAAEEARANAATAENYATLSEEKSKVAAQQAATATTQAAIARTGATVAMGHAQDTEEMIAAFAQKDYDEQLSDQNWRLAIVENHLGLESPIQIIETDVTSVEIPENAQRYAKISKLEGQLVMNSYSDGWYPQGVTAIRVLDANGTELRRYTVPVSALPDYGEGEAYTHGTANYDPEHHNYISFENGRAYYHHNVYSGIPSEEYGECTKRNEGDTMIYNCAWQTLMRLAQPEVIDITAAMGFDGFVDLSGGAKIVFDQLVAEDGDEVTNGIIYDWRAAYVFVIIETEL